MRHPREDLARRLEGPLDAATERAVAVHLGTCPDCRAFDVALRRSDALLARRVPLPAAPAFPPATAAARRFALPAVAAATLLVALATGAALATVRADLAGMLAQGSPKPSAPVARTPAASPSAIAGSATLHYVEGQCIEPWLAAAAWEPVARRELEAVGLHPLRLERVSYLPPDAVVPGACGAQTGYALRVAVPNAERDRALERCFSEEPKTPANARADCRPLYGAGASLPISREDAMARVRGLTVVIERVDWIEAKLVWADELATAQGLAPAADPRERVWAVAVRGVLHNPRGPERMMFTSGLFVLDLGGQMRSTSLRNEWSQAFNEVRDLLVDGTPPLCGVQVASLNERRWEATAHGCVELALAEGRVGRYVGISYTIEGGAIIRTLEVLPPSGASRVRVVVDDTRDLFAADPRVRRYECAGLRREPVDPAKPNGDYFFVAIGCPDAPGGEVAVP